MGKISKDIFEEESGDGDQQSDAVFKISKDYASGYDVWRKKEELSKLKTKYGENFLEDSESSSSDDEDAAELTEEVEKDFFKTLSYLKNKDPKIYDNSVNFFKNTDVVKKEKKKKEEPMYLKDYERKLLLEKGGKLEEETHDKTQTMSYVEEEKQIKEELLKQAADIEDEEEDGLGGLLEERKKSKEENEKETAEYLKWLAGQTDEIKDKQIKSELKPLKDFWNNPKLDSGEKFLRDYVLNKRYLESNEDNYVPTYDEIIHDSDESLTGDENEVEKQEEFEHKYNFRFEEPDQEFIKRYPRTTEKSLRKTDDRRKLKRAETKERKKKEKEDKMAEIKKLQELKRIEIEEKIEKLKEITGNKELGFQEDDIDGDFDPDAHDKRMQSLFNDDFYEGDEGDQKPEFPDIDKELEIENWEHWNAAEDGEQDNNEYEPHCEDDSFIMDADYDPSVSTKEDLIENTKGRKKRRRKSKVAEALSRPKPKYDPNDKNYEKYFDEFYKLDCEDIIGDIPCRFKYREVIPNDFGLSIEEILLAKDKELNRWCSLKKAVQHRPANVEKYDQIAYSKKANNISLKKRILPSLFSEEPDDSHNLMQPSTSSTQETKNNPSNSKNTNINETKSENDTNLKTEETNTDKSQSINSSIKVEVAKKKNKNKKKKKKIVDHNLAANKNDVEKSDKDANSSEDSPKKKQKNGEQKNPENKKKNRKRKLGDTATDKNGSKKIKKYNGSVDVGISDARLSAYGINPKKFKNKIKYGNKNKT